MRNTLLITTLALTLGAGAAFAASTTPANDPNASNSSSTVGGSSGANKGTDAAKPTDAECVTGWNSALQWPEDAFKKYCTK